MTTKTVTICDGCGKEIEQHSEFVILTRGGRKSLVLGADLEFCDYHCLLLRFKKDGHLTRFIKRTVEE